MTSAIQRPLVLVTSCNESPDYGSICKVRKSYLDAVRHAGCLPLVIPADTMLDEIPDLLVACHGLLFTGSPSNVHPRHYGKSLPCDSTKLDLLRDDWTLPLLRLAMDQEIPLLAICRGFQELNVALGGSLHQQLRDVEPYENHMPYESEIPDEHYAPAHSVTIEPGGMLYSLLGVSGIVVNSAHYQGIDRIAPPLRIEARADDGVIEAVSGPGGGTFQLGVQWHPEWRAAGNPHSSAIFRAFGEACARKASIPRRAMTGD